MTPTVPYNSGSECRCSRPPFKPHLCGRMAAKCRGVALCAFRALTSAPWATSRPTRPGRAEQLLNRMACGLRRVWGWGGGRDGMQNGAMQGWVGFLWLLQQPMRHGRHKPWHPGMAWVGGWHPNPNNQACSNLPKQPPSLSQGRSEDACAAGSKGGCLGRLEPPTPCTPQRAHRVQRRVAARVPHTHARPPLAQQQRRTRLHLPAPRCQCCVQRRAPAPILHTGGGLGRGRGDVRRCWSRACGVPSPRPWVR